MSQRNAVLTPEQAAIVARMRAGLSDRWDAERVEAALLRLRACEQALAPVAARCHCAQAFAAMSVLLPQARLPRDTTGTQTG
jgi:hypothetical protein